MYKSQIHLYTQYAFQKKNVDFPSSRNFIIAAIKCVMAISVLNLTFLVK